MKPDIVFFGERQTHCAACCEAAAVAVTLPSCSLSPCGDCDRLVVSPPGPGLACASLLLLVGDVCCVVPAGEQLPDRFYERMVSSSSNSNSNSARPLRPRRQAHVGGRIATPLKANNVVVQHDWKLGHSPPVGFWLLCVLTLCWLQEYDFPTCDLLLVMGTSLVVHPFASLIGQQ